ncbi:MAG TPA: oxygenase MpaB family protein [Egibacteraceae bacterium]|nr:oxygenase MpaB family protein [Egibacteraceae bacterium]
MTISPLRRVAAAAPEGLPGVRDLVRAGMGRVFGPPPFDPHADPGDPGLFGADSASARVIGEPAAIVGGIRALLVQLLHPLAMAGVAEHSRFRADPLGRLHSTSAYVTATAFGSSRQALDVARRVRRAHRLVRGTAPDGRPYQADDQHLLSWVSLALTSSFLATDRAYAPEPLDAASADAFVAEQSLAASLLDPRVDIDMIAGEPAAVGALRSGTTRLPMLVEGRLALTVADLTARMEAFRSELGLTAQGREALRFLAWPPLSPAVRTAYLTMLTGAVVSLQPWQRRLLGLPATRLGAWPLRAQTRALLAGFRVATGVSPSVAAARRRAGADPDASAA